MAYSILYRARTAVHALFVIITTGAVYGVGSLRYASNHSTKMQREVPTCIWDLGLEIGYVWRSSDDWSLADPSVGMVCEQINSYRLGILETYILSPKVLIMKEARAI
ncbi:hypothetical protein BDV18DRAFT_23790 [Aspergillus unguis]